MLKALFDRLFYALIGFVFGALLAVLLWYLYDYLPPNHWFRWRWPTAHAEMSTWIEYVGGFFAVIGFLFKDRVGEAMGDSLSDVYEDQASRYGGVPTTLAGIALLVVVVLMLSGWSPFS